MWKYLNVVFSVLIVSQWSFGQCINPLFDKEINKNIKNTIPLISVQELHKNFKKYIVLDTREYKEYEVSHIKNAQYVGFENFKFFDLNILDKAKPIVVYCSIGARSEIIGEKLKAAGFINVLNLYGSIFEWSNQGLPLFDSQNRPTNKVHTFNKEWSKWLQKGQKVY